MMTAHYLRVELKSQNNTSTFEIREGCEASDLCWANRYVPCFRLLSARADLTRLQNNRLA